MRDLEQGKEILDHLLLEHRSMNETVCSIMQLLNQAAQEPEGIEVKREAARRLHKLRRLVARHFRQEKDDGYMEEALVRLPRLSHKVAALQTRHAALLAELDRVLALSQEGRARAVYCSFERFAERLLAHETDENRVMAEAFGTDFAGEADNF